MAKPLDDRIAAALGANARAATVSSLIDEVQAAMLACQAEHDRLDALSKSATAAEDEADAAADQVSKLSRKLVRLAAKRDQLQARHDELMTSERRQRAVAEHEAVMARRDALVDDLKRDVPRLFGELVDLLQRIEASDAECEAANRSGSASYGLPWLNSAEAIARDVPGNFYRGGAPVTRLGQMKVPSFYPDGAPALAWPIDRGAAERQRIAEAERRDRLAAKQRLETQNAQWRDCIVTPPAHCANSIPISTYRGEMRVQRDAKQFKMTDEAIADARAKGCDVELLPAGKTLGMPSSVAVF